MKQLICSFWKECEDEARVREGINCSHFEPHPEGHNCKDGKCITFCNLTGRKSGTMIPCRELRPEECL